MSFRSGLFCCLFLIAFASLCPARILYVENASGSDYNNGLTIQKAFKTIQKAANASIPGDTVYVRNGRYGWDLTGWMAVVHITRSGTPNAWIRYMAFPGHTPVLHFECAYGFRVYGASYIEIAGFEVRGDKIIHTVEYALANRGKGIASLIAAGIVVFSHGDWNKPLPPYPTHVTIKNNLVHSCGGGGVGVKNADYIRIENNRVHSCAWWSQTASSGIMTGWGYNSDENTTDYKIIIQGNIAYRNHTYIPWGKTSNYSDGNGIIIDSHNNHDMVGQSPYRGRSLIANNVCYANGGSGLHTFRSANIDIFHNTVYNNSQCKNGGGGFAISAHYCQNVRIMNNIMSAPANKPMYLLDGMVDVVYDYNIYHGGFDVTETGPNGKIVTDPLFVGPADDSTANLSLREGSPAIDYASSLYMPETDITGTPRPRGTGPDAGAYESGFTTKLNAAYGPAYLLTRKESCQERFVFTLRGQRIDGESWQNRKSLFGGAQGVYAAFSHTDRQGRAFIRYMP